MPRDYKRMLLLIAAVIACGSIAWAQPATHTPKVIRLLTVGNSFSGNATRYLHEIAVAAGDKLILGRADLGGCSMERHWKIVEAAEADPKAEAGRPYTVTVGAAQEQHSLQEILASQKWDVVTIQQASILSPDLSTYRPYALNLRDYIKKHARQAEVVIHETWAYRCDDPGFGKDGNSQEKMYQSLRAAYRTVAKDLGLRVMPVGDAFYAAETDPAWCYKPAAFDKAALKHPNLPDQTHSIHVGWQWAKDAKEGYRLAMDCHHASDYGCYLAGCVWFEVLSKQSVEDNKFAPAGMPESDAKYLRGLAHKIVQAQSH